MLELVIKDAVFKTDMADKPRVFTTRPEHASSLMQGRVFTLLGAYELDSFNSDHFLTETQRLAVLDYMHDIRNKMAPGCEPPSGPFIESLIKAANLMDFNNAPRSPEEFKGKGGIILLPTGRSIMIYHVLTTFESRMLDDHFRRSYYGSLEAINDASSYSSDLKGYIESTYDQMTSVLLRRDERGKYVVSLDTVTGIDYGVLARAYALVRVFGAIA